MKKILITSLLFIVTFSYSQNFSCGTTGFIPFSTNFNRPSIPDPVDPDSTTPYVINAFFTLLKDGDGHTVIDNWGGNELGTDEQIENKFLECIKILNIQYNQYHIYFKYTGYKKASTSDTNIQGFSGTSYEWGILQQLYKEPNTMNFYFINTGNSNSYSLIGGVDSTYPIVALHSSNYGYLYYMLTHEVAHNLSIYQHYIFVDRHSEFC